MNQQTHSIVRPITVLLAVMFVAGAVSCHSEQDVRDRLADKKGCEIKKIEHQGSGSYMYTLHCGDKECTGTMNVKKSIGSSSSSSFESCYLRDEACRDDAAENCLALGNNYASKNVKKAHGFYDRACKASARLCQKVGNEYFDKDKKVALEYYRRACEKPRLECVHIGDKWFGSDEKIALTFYDKGCEASARGCAHTASKFIKNKPTVAAEYLDKGCTGTHLHGGACFTIGRWLEQGKNVKKDMKKARLKYADGCKEKDAAACNNLGVMHARGEGGRRDTAKAMDLYEKGCSLESKESCNTLHKICKRGIKKGCEKLKKARETNKKWEPPLLK